MCWKKKKKKILSGLRVPLKSLHSCAEEEGGGGGGEEEEAEEDI